MTSIRFSRPMNNPAGSVYSILQSLHECAEKRAAERPAPRTPRVRWVWGITESD
jgi:hypothetical protein